MKIAVIGSTGQIGTDLVKVFLDYPPKFDLHSLTHADMEICDHENMGEILKGINPDVLINTVVYHRTDDCEDNPERCKRGFSMSSSSVNAVIEG